MKSPSALSLFPARRRDGQPAQPAKSAKSEQSANSAKSVRSVLSALPRAAFAAGLIAFALLFAVFPDRYVPVCLDGIALWALNVLPAVFPFLFVSSLLRLTGGAEKVSRFFSPLSRALFAAGGESDYCLFMSLLSGYPVGASLVASYRREGGAGLRETEILACTCSVSGPLFVLGSVGAGMFGDKKTGFLILAAHLLSALLSGILLRFLLPRRPEATAKHARAKERLSLSDGVQRAAVTAIGAGGCIAVFYVLSAMLSDFGILAPLQGLLGKIPPLAPYAEGLTKGLVEMTGGCLAVAGQGELAPACCAFLVTLGGASLLFQQIVCLRPAGVRISLFLAVKFLQAVAAFFLCLLFCAL